MSDLLIARILRGEELDDLWWEPKAWGVGKGDDDDVLAEARKRLRSWSSFYWPLRGDENWQHRLRYYAIDFAWPPQEFYFIDIDGIQVYPRRD